MDFNDREIDVMVLTHPHDDHVAGLVEVLKRYRVKRALYTGVIHSAPAFLEWLDIINEQGIPLVIIDRPQKIKLDDKCWLDILYPIQSLLGQEVDNLNNSSIVARLSYGQHGFLFTGDAEMEIERILLDGDIDFSSQVLKVGHHGSITSSGEEFIAAVAPDFAVVQVGADNSFGHPSRRVLKRLERSGAAVYRNDIHGTIKFISDGEEIRKIQ